jgi:ABC-2 type transport system permease protein
VHARLLRSWRTDPRYISGVAALLVMPAVFVALIVPAFGLDPRWSYAAPFVLAASIGWGRHNDVALDSSALWLDIVAGRRGGAVMRGRFSAVTVWALPFVVAVALVVAGWTDHWELAPALVGASVGTLGSTLGVAAIASVTLPYRAPAPGENPFNAEVGSVGAGFVAQLASSAATIVVVPFAVVPCILAVVVDARWGIVATIGGLSIGIGGYLVALRAAGRIYDSRSGSLLAAVR